MEGIMLITLVMVGIFGSLTKLHMLTSDYLAHFLRVMLGIVDKTIWTASKVSDSEKKKISLDGVLHWTLFFFISALVTIEFQSHASIETFKLTFYFLSMFFCGQLEGLCDWYL